VEIGRHDPEFLSECREEQEAMLLMPANSWFADGSSRAKFMLQPFVAWPWSARLFSYSVRKECGDTMRDPKGSIHNSPVRETCLSCANLALGVVTTPQLSRSCA